MKRFGLFICCVFVCVGYAGNALAGDDVAGDAKAIRAQQAELKKSLAQVKKRLNLQKDADLQGLNQAVKDAQKAYQEGVNAKLQQAPEGARIIEEMAALDAQIKAMKPARVKKDKGPRKPKGERKGQGQGRKGKKNQDDDEQDEQDEAGDVEIFE